jgi:hypothetical protein
MIKRGTDERVRTLRPGGHVVLVDKPFKACLVVMILFFIVAALTISDVFKMISIRA